MKKFAIPSGTKDLLFDECRSKKQLQKEIEQVFESYGYQEIMTPTIEFFKTYQVGFEDVQEEAMYKFFDENGRILVLRADMTIPIARVATTKLKGNALPLRFYYCANVYKVKQTFAGKRNEVSDCGIELLGSNRQESDLEVLVCALEVMEKMQQKAYTLELSDVRFFEQACKLVAMKESEKAKLASLIDSKSLTELESYLNQLQLDEKVKDFFMQLPWLGGNVEVLEEAKSYCFHESLLQVIDDLKVYYDQLSALGYEQYITYDLGKIPHLNYYSGLIFEGYIENVGNSVLSGGRYDQLLEKFNESMPAIGFSVKLDYVLNAYQYSEQKAKVVVSYPLELQLEAFKYAKQLRKDKIVVMKVDQSKTEIEVN